MARQLEEKYTTSLFDKRLEVYPSLSKALNELSNAIEHNTQSKQHLVEFQSQFEKWISSNAIFLTPTTARIVWGYYHYLIDLIDQHRDKPIHEDQWVEMRNIQLTIGKFLRAELGVFDTKPAGTSDLEEPYVKEILDKLNSSSKKIRSRFGY
jgi:hypothetical protein